MQKRNRINLKNPKKSHSTKLQSSNFHFACTLVFCTTCTETFLNSIFPKFLLEKNGKMKMLL